MTQNATNNDEEESVIDQEYQPIYEYDEDAGPSYLTTGEVVDKVPRKDQIEALQSIAGDGPIEPDGWFEGYSYGTALPIINGVPLTVIERSRTVNNKHEGVESSHKYAVDDSLGIVELHKAGVHPSNTSKIKVNKQVHLE